MDDAVGGDPFGDGPFGGDEVKGTEEIVEVEGDGGDERAGRGATFMMKGGVPVLAGRDAKGAGEGGALVMGTVGRGRDRRFCWCAVPCGDISGERDEVRGGGGGGGGRRPVTAQRMITLSTDDSA